MNNPVKGFYDWYEQAICNPKYRCFVIIGTVLYLLSSIDVLPDIIPVLGWIDDGVLATFLVTEVAQMVFSRNRSSSEKKENEIH